MAQNIPTPTAAGNIALVPTVTAAVGPPAVAAFDNPAFLSTVPTFKFVDEATATPEPIFVFGAVVSDDAEGTLTVPVQLHSGIVLGNVNDVLTRDEYSIRVRIVIDGDNQVDGNDDDDEADELLLGQTAVDNDHDYTFTADITLNVMGIKAGTDDLSFDVVPSKAVKGAKLSGIRRPINSNPLQWEVTGIGSSAKLIDDGIGAVTIGGNASTAVEVKEVPEGSGKFQLFVKASGVSGVGGAADLLQPHADPSEFTVTLQYDEDTGVDSDDIVATAKDSNVDVPITLSGIIGARTALSFSGTIGEATPVTVETAGDPVEGIHYAFTIPQSVSANTPIGYFVVEGRIDAVVDDVDTANVDESKTMPAEYLDGIISGSNSGLFDVRDSDMTLVYSGDGSLDVGVYELDLTVSGDGGMANRTIIGKAQVTVTASNQAPTIPSAFSETIKENEPSAEVAPDLGPPVVAAVPGNGVRPGAAVGDASAGVDANDGDSLTYSVVLGDVKAGLFVIDRSTGMVSVGTGGISDSSVKEGTGLEEDNDSTASVDESVAVYERSDGG